MPRRIQWGLLLLVALAFVAPGAARVRGETLVRAAGPRAGRSALGPTGSRISAGVVRQGVDVDDARSEKAASQRRLDPGARPANVAVAAPAGCAGSVDCADHHPSSWRSTVSLRAPPLLLG
jgi:hypothetical protein